MIILFIAGIILPILLIIAGLSFDFINNQLANKIKPIYNYIIFISLLIICCYWNLKPNTLKMFHKHGMSDYNWENRQAKIHNTEIYKSLDTYLNGNYIIFNSKPMEYPEVMFFSNQNVYNWWPEKEYIDSLKNQGYKIAAFTSHGNQILPAYIVSDPYISIIEKVLY